MKLKMNLRDMKLGDCQGLWVMFFIQVSLMILGGGSIIFRIFSLAPESDSGPRISGTAEFFFGKIFFR